MKRWTLIVSLVVVAVVGSAYLAFEAIVEKAIETLGPALTGTSVVLEDVDLSVFDGRGSVSGLVIGNPSGFKTKYAARLREVRVHLVPTSVLRQKLIIRDIYIDTPEINFEKKENTDNLEQILGHLQAALGGKGRGGDESTDPEALWNRLTDQKLQLDHFLMKNAQIHVSAKVLNGKTLDVPPVSIELEGLGTHPDGKSVAEVSAKVMRKVSSQVSAEVTRQMLTLGLGGEEEEEREPQARRRAEDGTKPGRQSESSDETRRSRRRRGSTEGDADVPHP